MKILYVTHYFPPEVIANAIRVYEISKYLKANGAWVEVLCPHPCFPPHSFKTCKSYYRREEMNKLIVHRLYNYQLHDYTKFYFQRGLYYSVFPILASLWIPRRAKNYDVIITSTPPPTIDLVGFTAKKFNKKILWIQDLRDLSVAVARDFKHIPNRFYDIIIRLYEKHLWNNIDLIANTTKRMSEDLREKYNLPEEKFFSLPNATNLTIFKNRKLERENIIVYAGNIGIYQDLEKVILAMKYVNAKLYIIGGGEKRRDLENLVNNKKFFNILFFDKMPRDKLSKLLNRCKVGIAPLKHSVSLRYAMPSKVFDYVACGLAVLGTGSEGELKDFIENNNVGIMAKNNVGHIAEKLNFLLENFKEYSKNAFKVSKKHDRKVIIKKFYKRIEEELDARNL